MKQSLQLRLGQHITMTPQLQQAIRLLQLSTLELQLEIQQALESNIMLEEAEDDEDDDDYEFNNNDESPTIDSTQDDNPLNHSATATDSSLEFTNSSSSSSSTEDQEEPNFDNHLIDNISEDLVTDSSWDDIYDGTVTTYESSTGNSEDGNNKDSQAQNTAVQTLQDHLRWQLELTHFTEVDHTIALAIVDAIEEDGYLHTSLSEIAQSVSPDFKVDEDEVEAVLHRVQRFDPIGIGARNLSECLLLQLNELAPNTPWLKEARHLANKYLDLLAIHDHVQLGKRLKLERDELREVINLILSLQPRPGAQIESHQAMYVVPDVFVKKIKEQWKVELNAEISPKLRINTYYASLISRTTNSSDVSSLKNHLQEARWFIKSLKSRHETLLKVARCIVQRQAAFLEYGEEAMKPLVLHDIASELEMHESTISRVTTQKYIHTPRGIFELKYFFSSHVSTNNGGEFSSTAIRALIKKLIATENVAKPLSDSKIAKMLSERGIKVARRTVAKYREAMLVPPSNERKRLT